MRKNSESDSAGATGSNARESSPSKPHGGASEKGTGKMNHLPTEAVERLRSAFPQVSPSSATTKLVQLLCNWEPPRSLEELDILHEALSQTARTILSFENTPRVEPCAPFLEDLRDGLYGMTEEIIAIARKITPANAQQAACKASIILRACVEYHHEACEFVSEIDELRPQLTRSRRLASV